MRANYWLLLLFFFALPAHAVQIQTWTLANGARVFFVASHEIPMATLRVTFDAGSARDPRDLPGLASFTAGMLDKGAGGLSEDAIAEALDRTGGEISGFADRDQGGIQVKSLSDPKLRDAVAALAGKILSAPDFPQAVLQREKRRTVAAIEQSDENPDTVADKAFMRAVYGEHPYAHPSMGTRRSVPHFTRAAAQAFYRRYYVGANAVVAVVGDLSRAQAERWAEQIVGRLPRGAVPPPLPPAPMLQGGKELFLAMPVNQTYILMGQPGIARSSPDYFPLLVGNYTLGGGGFGSRLMTQVREKRGLSYSVYSYFYPLRQAGPFVSGLQTATPQAGEALKVMQETVQAYVRTGPTPKELRAAKDYLTGSFPLRLDSNAKILEYLGLIGFYRLPLDYLDTFRQRVEAVTAQDVRAALARHLDPRHMVTVAVGSRAPDARFVGMQ